LEAAFARLAVSLEIAAPEGLTRIYLEYGQPMAALLRAYLQNQSATPVITNFIQNLLLSFDEPYQPATSQPEPTSPLPAQSLRLGANRELIEPLSMRERQVLKLLATSLSSIEIGRELVVATSTVRTHIKNIYAKLEVQRRAEAISRAKELGLL
jgi:LuxR family maltose regulon positive regulatory protein